MKYKLKISPKSHEDIQSIYNYVKKDGMSVAKKQVNDIYDSLQKVQELPEIGKSLIILF